LGERHLTECLFHRKVIWPKKVIQRVIWLKFYLVEKSFDQKVIWSKAFWLGLFDRKVIWPKVRQRVIFDRNFIGLKSHLTEKSFDRKHFGWVYLTKRLFARNAILSKAPFEKRSCDRTFFYRGSFDWNFIWLKSHLT
jgi:hypothetical protein